VGFDWVIPAAALGLGAAALLLLVPRGRPRRRIGLLLLLPALVWTIGIRGAPPGELTVVFFDVGQGDAALVRTPEGVDVLLDGGPDDQLVATKLAALGVGRIDLVVASHAHADHLEGIPAVLARHHVGLLLEPGCPAESPSYRRLLATAEAEGVAGRSPRGGERLRVGRLLIEVLGPDTCAVDSPNDDSLVLRLSYDGAAVLFPGDAEIPAQRDVLDDGDPVTAGVLKVPHHGSATSDPAFLEAVGARVAVVSVGENDFGHPVPEILEALRRTGARVLRTDLEGDVTVRLGPEGLRVESASS
jgi:competence protein ComEC